MSCPGQAAVLTTDNKAKLPGIHIDGGRSGTHRHGRWPLGSHQGETNYFDGQTAE